MITRDVIVNFGRLAFCLAAIFFGDGEDTPANDRMRYLQTSFRD